ncbi:MAG: hypothetical protein KY475_00445 [Planctomycetes bacterium]|nr:hypothetical protein [Planctomycetota bacterium]
MTESTRDFFDTLSSVLFRCWTFGFVLLFIWLGALFSGAVHNLHGPLMNLTGDELDVIHYCGVASLKLVVLVFFFIPWMSIKLALRKAKPASR